MMDEASSKIEATENTAAEPAAQIAALEQELLALLRRKYEIYWRRKESAAALSDADPEAGRELAALQEKIKSVFDQIRLIDKKYVLPDFRMFE